MILEQGPDTIAAFFAEPIMGAGGVIVPPKGYFANINKVLEKYDIRFIGDEVICGFGRTGNWFGTETMGMKAQSISMAKAITSAYFPMGAITIEEDLYQAMLDESRKLGIFGHGFTYTAHPVGCAVALKTIEIYERERIVEHVKKVAPIFEGRIAKLGEHPLVGESARRRPDRRVGTRCRQEDQARLRSQKGRRGCHRRSSPGNGRHPAFDGRFGCLLPAAHHHRRSDQRNVRHRRKGPRPHGRARPQGRFEGSMSRIGERQRLRDKLGEVGDLAAGKTIRKLDKYARVFIEHSPFLCIGTSDADGNADVSPRGDPAGLRAHHR